MRKTPDDPLAQSQDEQELFSLMKKTQAGDAEAYRLFLKKVTVLIRSQVSHSIKRMGISDPASGEDIVQEILLAIHCKRDTYDPNQYFLPWFYAIVRHKMIDAGRRNRHIRNQVSVDELNSIEEIPDIQSDPNHPIDLQERLRSLSKKQREILALSKIDGLSLQEVSIKTGFSLSDVKVTIHRAILQLKKNATKESKSENG